MKNAVIVGNIRDKSLVDNRAIVVEEKYYQFALHGGFCPLIIPYTLDQIHLEYYLKYASCVIFTGGGDISPSLYSEEIHAKTHTPDCARDENELRLLHYVFQHTDIPLLAICRGMQLLNIYLGGTLHQDISLHWGQEILYKHYGDKDKCHEIQLDKKMKASCPQESYYVNSHHHQAVKTPGKGVVPIAFTRDDNILEAFSTSSRKNVLAVQWHPERMLNSSGELKVWDFFPYKSRF